MTRVWGYLLTLLVYAISQPALSNAAVTCEKLLTAVQETQNAPPADQGNQGIPLRVMTYNMLDLLIETSQNDRQPASESPSQSRRKKTKANLDNSDTPPKSNAALTQQAEIINELKPDILVLEEVHSKASLDAFVENFLDEDYQVFLTRGNDARGIEIGMLVKKSVAQNYVIEYRSHKDLKTINPTTRETEPVFSRDAPTLILKEKSTGATKLIVMGVHNKSKRPSPGDPESAKIRAKQLEVAGELVKQFQTEFGDTTPILLAGDFNTGLHEAPETESILRIMTDVFDLLARPPPEQERITHTFHPSGAPAEYRQIDGILATRTDRLYVKSVHVVRYRDQNGGVLPLPRTFNQRSKQPSDHFPIVSDVVIR